MITIFKNIKTTAAGFFVTPENVFNRIRSGKSKDLLTKIRSELDKEKRNILKKELPSICFSGTFTNRAASGLKAHSGLICLDFDKIPTLEDLNALRETLEGDSYTYACFISPSGNGLKVIVKILADATTHKSQFDALKDYYNNPYFDTSTSDVSRVCFESYDPNIYVNPDSLVFERTSSIPLDKLGEKTLIPETRSLVIIDILTKWWQNNNNAKFVDGNRNNSLFILAAAFNRAGIDKLEAKHHFYQFVTSDFTHSEVEQIVDSAYRDTLQFKTVTFENKELKGNIKQAIKAGKSDAELKNTFSHIQKVDELISNLKDETPVNEFWTIDKNGRYFISHSLFKQYLQNNQVFKFYPTESSFVFVKVESNKVKILKEEQIKDFVLNDLYTREGIGIKPFELMAGATKYFKSDYLSFLDNIDLNIKSDTQDCCYLYYKNCVLEVTKNGTKKIDYIDLDGYVWENRIIDRDFEEVSFEDSMYQQFVWLVSNKDDDRYNTIKSVIGYLLHSYKTSANNKAIIFNDEVISENPNGGSGKGLLVQGFNRMKKVAILDGKQFDFDKSFTYQTVDLDTQILVYDDVKKNFNFERLFSVITEGITIERKNKDATRLTIKESPKVLITTNYTIGGVGGSFERRKFEIELSSYFGSHHTPLDEFGKMLFDEWDMSDWQAFDSFMIDCIKHYLRFGLIESNYTNLVMRKFIKDTSYEFYEFSILDEMIQTNQKYYNAIFAEKFIEIYPDFKKWNNFNKRLGHWVNAYAELKGYEVERGASSGRYFLLKDLSNLPSEIPF